jgi:hypothetical protein
VGVLAVAVRQQTPQAQHQQLVVIPAAPAPAADSAPCRALSAALPAQLGDYRRVAAADPVPVGAAAWQATPDGDSVVLRCGLERPGEFVVGSPLQMVDAVQWFLVSDPPSPGTATWFAVDRGAYVALTLPAGSGPTPIQELSEVIATTMPEKPLDPGPPPG